MKRLLVIPFRFGRAAGDILSYKMWDFYLATARMVFSGVSLSEDSETTITIPLSFDMVLDAGLIFKIVEEQLSAVDHSFVVIDLSRPSEFVLTTHHVIAGILRAITADKKQGRQRQFLLLISTMLPRDDVVMLALAPLIDSGVLGVIADNGDSVGLATSHLDAIAHRDRVIRVNIPQINLFQKKLIRFPGHFTISAGSTGSACTNFYFDGSLCQRELVELIDGFVGNHFPSLDGLLILYDSVISRWCETAVLAFCERRNLRSWNMSGPSSPDHDYAGFTRVLLILPLVDSGQTARDLVLKIRDASPALEITILAMLSTRGEDLQDGVIAPSVWNGPVPIHFFLKVMRAQYFPPHCPLCQAGVPRSDPLHPDPLTRLSSHAFWTLAADVGFEEERDVPPYRQSIGQVPRLRTLEAENGAFLAYKVEKLLRTTGNLPVDPVVICPMEDGAQAIGDYLETVFNMTVIRLPKSVLESHVRMFDRNAAWPALGDTASETTPPQRWEVQIGTLINYRERIRARGPVFGRQQSNVIVLDELNVSGGTRKNLMKFAADCGLEILCCVSVMDFSGNTQEALSLYDINIPLPISG